jgi:hypothetical protein
MLYTELEEYAEGTPRQSRNQKCVRPAFEAWLAVRREEERRERFQGDYETRHCLAGEL